MPNQQDYLYHHSDLHTKHNSIHHTFSRMKMYKLKISLMFVPKGPINNILACVQIMAWWWPGDKPLSEPMMLSLLTDICITQPQWVNPWTLGNAWVRSQHCGYWSPGVKAPGHQYPQCWLNIHCIGPISYKDIAHKVNSIRKWNHILKKITQSFKG